MEAVIRQVRDIDSDDRQVLEHVIGRQLTENQQLIIQVVTLGNMPAEHANEPPARPGKLPEWCNVYDGLTDEQIADVEEVILQRSDLSRPSK